MSIYKLQVLVLTPTPSPVQRVLSLQRDTLSGTVTDLDSEPGPHFETLLLTQGDSWTSGDHGPNVSPRVYRPVGRGLRECGQATWTRPHQSPLKKGTRNTSCPDVSFFFTRSPEDNRYRITLRLKILDHPCNRKVDR